MPKPPQRGTTATTDDSHNNKNDPATSPTTSSSSTRRPGVIRSLLAAVLVVAMMIYGRLFSTLSMDPAAVVDLQQQQQDQQEEEERALVMTTTTGSDADVQEPTTLETSSSSILQDDAAASPSIVEDTQQQEETNAETTDTKADNVEDAAAVPKEEDNISTTADKNSQGEAKNDDSKATTTLQEKSTTHTEDSSSLALPWNEPTPQDLEQLQECFPLNSKEWLSGPRHGNIQQDDTGMDAEFIANMILFGQTPSLFASTTTIGSDTTTLQNNPTRLLQQSMCHKDSRFLNASDAQMDDRSIQVWIVRITYMAMHKLQHQFAAEEALHRVSSLTTTQAQCPTLAKKYQIGSFDYECPEGRFFIVPIENLGLGAVIRTTVLSGYLAALATNRAVLFVNHAPSDKADPVIQKDWYHASCPRFDVQCFYHPPTPCVLTLEQLEKATLMTGFKNTTKLFKNPDRLRQDDWFDQTQSIILPLKTVTRRVPKNIPHILRNFTLEFMSGLPDDDARRPVLEQVAARFVSSVYHDKVLQLISYGLGKKTMSGLFLFPNVAAVITVRLVLSHYSLWATYLPHPPLFLVFYAMRPHLKSQDQLHQIMEKVLTTAKSFTPQTTFGLPVRGA